MNPRTRKAALYAIAAIAILASANALAHSYAGLYDWAIHHRLTGWQAMSWPAEIDVFLAVGELALYVAYLDAWPARQRIWPWVTALTGLAVSVAGNVGHIQASPGDPVSLADRHDCGDQPARGVRGPVRRAARGEDDPPARGPAASSCHAHAGTPTRHGVALMRPAGDANEAA